MRWELDIAGDSTALQRLVCDTANISPRVVAIDDKYRLEWDGLDALTEVHEVESAAMAHVQQLDGVASLLLLRGAGLHLTGTAQRRPDGGRVVYISIREEVRVSSSIQTTVTKTGPDGRPVQVHDENFIPGILEITAQDETAAKVLRLVREDLDNWPALFRLFEVIEDTVGGKKTLATLTGIPTGKWSAFTTTANSPLLSGDASRHGVQRGTPPQNALSLTEARQMLRNACRIWLLSRVEQSQTHGIESLTPTTRNA